MKPDTRKQSDILFQGHWDRLDFVQRMTAKDWRHLLLNHWDNVVFRGRVYDLQGKHIGAGVYEVRKG